MDIILLASLDPLLEICASLPRPPHRLAVSLTHVLTEYIVEIIVKVLVVQSIKVARLTGYKIKSETVFFDYLKTTKNEFSNYRLSVTICIMIDPIKIDKKRNIVHNAS